MVPEAGVRIRSSIDEPRRGPARGGSGRVDLWIAGDPVIIPTGRRSPVPDPKHHLPEHQMRHAASSAILLGIIALGGCGNAAGKVVGTWEGRAVDDAAPFSFGAVTFAPDGTFTAEARYGETTRAVSGRYSMDGETITLDGQGIPPRVYAVSRGDDTAVFTDQATGRSMTLDRFR